MRTRDELDAAWRKQIAATVFVGSTSGVSIRELIADERALNQREAQARAIRWAADKFPVGAKVLRMIADRVESGELEVPK